MIYITFCIVVEFKSFPSDLFVWLPWIISSMPLSEIVEEHKVDIFLSNTLVTFLERGLLFWFWRSLFVKLLLFVEL